MTFKKASEFRRLFNIHLHFFMLTCFVSGDAFKIHLK